MIKKYSIITIGICFFVKENDIYIGYPYDFYVFPCHMNEKFDVNIDISVNCIEFLNKYTNIDFH